MKLARRLSLKRRTTKVKEKDWIIYKLKMLPKMALYFGIAIVVIMVVKGVI